MRNKEKAKRRLKKSLSRRKREIERDRLNSAFRNIFVKSGYISKVSIHE
jgi:hypothetical protein